MSKDRFDAIVGIIVLSIFLLFVLIVYFLSEFGQQLINKL